MRKAITHINKKANKNFRILLLVDSRLPYTSVNNELINHKTFPNLAKKDILLVFTKVDLISNYRKNSLRTEYSDSYFANYSKKNYCKFFIDWIRKHTCYDSFFSSFFIVGIPNVGKSTFIKRHCVGKQIETSKQPGSTKGISKIKLTPTITLYDTPGISFKHQLDDNSTAKLVLCNLIKPDQYDIEMVLNFGLNYLYQKKQDILIKLFPKVSTFIHNSLNFTKRINLLKLISRTYFKDSIASIVKNNWILRRIQLKADCEWE